MKTIPLLPIVAACVALSAPCLFAAPLSEALVNRVQKDVRITENNGAARPAGQGDKVSGDQAVRTGALSAAELLFPDQTLTRLGSDTLFTFEGGTRKMNLESGTMLFQIPKGVGGASIRTGAITAAITGTTGFVERGKTHYKLVLLEGSMRVFLNNRLRESMVIEGGQMLIGPIKDVSLKSWQTVQIDTAKLMKTSKLLNNKKFSPLAPAATEKIEKVIVAQQAQLQKGNLTETNLVIEGYGTKLQAVNDVQESTAALKTEGINAGSMASPTPILVVSNSPDNGPVAGGGSGPGSGTGGNTGGGATPGGGMGTGNGGGMGTGSGSDPGSGPTPGPGSGPTPGLEPGPTPGPTPIPGPTPGSTPEPTPGSTPEPTPGSTPGPTPSPTPDSGPTPGDGTDNGSDSDDGDDDEFDSGSGNAYQIGTANSPSSKSVKIDKPIDTTTLTGKSGNTSNGKVGIYTTSGIKVESSIKAVTSQGTSPVTTGGEIILESRKQTGTAITINSTAQLNALVGNMSPTSGGKINIKSFGGFLNIFGSIKAPAGTVDIQNTGSYGYVSFTDATISANVVKAGALGNNGTLTINGGTISADLLLKIYANSNNGTVRFYDNATLNGNSMKIISGNTVQIDNGKVVTINGTQPATIYTNHPNYSGSGGNGQTSGIFGNKGATTKPQNQAPGY